MDLPKVNAQFEVSKSVLQVVENNPEEETGSNLNSESIDSIPRAQVDRSAYPSLSHARAGRLFNICAVVDVILSQFYRSWTQTVACLTRQA